MKDKYFKITNTIKDKINKPLSLKIFCVFDIIVGTLAIILSIYSLYWIYHGIVILYLHNNWKGWGTTWILFGSIFFIFCFPCSFAILAGLKTIKLKRAGRFLNIFLVAPYLLVVAIFFSIIIIKEKWSISGRPLLIFEIFVLYLFAFILLRYFNLPKIKNLFK